MKKLIFAAIIAALMLAVCAVGQLDPAVTHRVVEYYGGDISDQDPSSLEHDSGPSSTGYTSLGRVTAPPHLENKTFEPGDDGGGSSPIDHAGPSICLDRDDAKVLADVLGFFNNSQNVKLGPKAQAAYENLSIAVRD